MPCCPPGKAGTARELQQLEKDGWNTWNSCKKSLASSVAQRPLCPSGELLA